MSDRRNFLNFLDRLVLINPAVASELMDYYLQVPFDSVRAQVLDPRFPDQPFSFRPAGSIDGCMSWRNTPHGRDYWSDLNTEYNRASGRIATGGGL